MFNRGITQNVVRFDNDYDNNVKYLNVYGYKKNCTCHQTVSHFLKKQQYQTSTDLWVIWYQATVTESMTDFI